MQLSQFTRKKKDFYAQPIIADNNEQKSVKGRLEETLF